MTRTEETRSNEGKKTRQSENRIYEALPEYDMDYESPLEIPASIKKDGYSYRWVNIAIIPFVINNTINESIFCV